MYEVQWQPFVDPPLQEEHLRMWTVTSDRAEADIDYDWLNDTFNTNGDLLERAAPMALRLLEDAVPVKELTFT